jgi:hypothetical protein
MASSSSEVWIRLAVALLLGAFLVAVGLALNGGTVDHTTIAISK